jgi:hypothetical protein
MHESALTDWQFPHGGAWQDPTKCGEKLYAKAQEALAKDAGVCAAVSEQSLASLDATAVEALAAKCAAVLAAKQGDGASAAKRAKTDA